MGAPYGPPSGTRLGDVGPALVGNLPVPHTCRNEAEKDAKLNCILAQARQFPVLGNLRETNCPHFVLVQGRKWVQMCCQLLFCSCWLAFINFRRESKYIMKRITEKEVARPRADSEENFNLFFES